MVDLSEKFWIVSINSVDENYLTNIGIVNDLEVFKRMAKEQYDIETEPIKDEFGRGSLHYEYSIKRSERFTVFYELIAEPTNILL